MKTKTLLSFLLYFSFLFHIISCNNSNETAVVVADDIPAIDFAKLQKSIEYIDPLDRLAAECRGVREYDAFFESYEAVFLEGTEDIATDDVKKVQLWKDELTLLMAKGKLLCYNYLSGEKNKTFEAKESDYISFDVVKDKYIYALAGSSSYTVNKLDSTGLVIDKISLNEGFEYDNIVLLDSVTVLVSAVTYPYPVTFTVNFKTHLITQIDVPAQENEKTDNKFTDSLKVNYRIPSLYNFSKNKNGDVIGKYLFDNMFYKYTAAGKEPFIMAKTAMDIEYKSNIHKKKNIRDYYIPVSMFELMDSLYMFIWNKDYMAWDKFRMYTKYTLYDSNLDFAFKFSDSMCWEDKEFRLYDLFGFYNIHFSSPDRMIFKVQKTADPTYRYYGRRNLPTWPEHIRKDMPCGNLVLVHYKLHEKFIDL